MTGISDKPFFDQHLASSVPGGQRHLHHLPRPCWTRKSTGQPLKIKRIFGIILHKISGMYMFPQDPFNPELIDNRILVPNRYSYGIMVFRDGQAARRVPEEYQAFHAGLSRYEGREYCNGFMIGLSIVSKGMDTPSGVAFESVQIDKVIDVCAHLINEHDFPIKRITSHEHARSSWNGHHPENPGDSRRGDPGDFPWTKFRNRLSEKLRG